jgi:hypothetical protein
LKDSIIIIIIQESDDDAGHPDDVEKNETKLKTEK